MLDIHARALEEVNEALHNFLLRYKAPARIVYGFVEGKDDPMFYKNIIERFLPEGWNVDLTRAGNKAKVWDCYQSINWSSYSRQRVCFFVDRDLDDLVTSNIGVGSNIYVTNGYSIENDVVNRALVIQLLSEVYNVVDLLPDEEEAIKKFFDTDLLKFQQWLSPVMAQIVNWRRENVKARLDDIDLKSMIGFHEGRVELKVGFENEESRILHASNCVGATACAKSLLDMLTSEFEAVNGPERLVRGKYLLWFMQSFLASVHASIAKFAHAYNTSPKMKVTVGVGNFQIFAASRARCPQSLRLFIEKNYLAFIDSATRGQPA